jgi:5-methylcytosine-specific restriction enzyme A
MGDNAVMSKSSRRTSALPKNWPVIRKAVLERDGYRCQWGMLPDEHLPGDYPCNAVANEVDHIGMSWDHSYEALRSLCRVHHMSRTAQQANTARWKKAGSKKRPNSKHPGVKE